MTTSALATSGFRCIGRFHSTEGMAVHLEYERFVNEYKSEPIPKKLRLDSHYGACFVGVWPACFN